LKRPRRGTRRPSEPRTVPSAQADGQVRQLGWTLRPKVKLEVHRWCVAVPGWLPSHWDAHMPASSMGDRVARRPWARDAPVVRHRTAPCPRRRPTGRPRSWAAGGAPDLKVNSKSRSPARPRARRASGPALYPPAYRCRRAGPRLGWSAQHDAVSGPSPQSSWARGPASPC
jgi:hypothetical protein